MVVVTTLKNAVPVLAAVDFPAAVAFWRDVLGFAGTDHGQFATLRRDDVDLFIGGVDNQVIPDNTMAWIRTGDVKALYDEWSARIAASPFADKTRVVAIQEQPWGAEFVIVDPAGNCVHVAQS
jgi:catechol 2,3-dioxygenase-like lactoylglutathione lyase family enzyme